MKEFAIERRALLRAGFGLGLGGLLPGAGMAQALLREGKGLTTSQALVDRYVAEKKLPGALMAIGRGTAPPAYAAAGTLAFDQQVPRVGPDSLWRVYSMTKPITGMAAMILVGEGKLKLDQPIADLLPAYASMKVLTDPQKSLDSRPAKRPITVRHLLTHTAGLGYTIVTTGPLLQEYLRLGLTPAVVSRTQPLGPQGAPTAPSLAEFADRLATLPLIADPGERWSYSVSLDLLGRVIEVASGVAFDAFLKQRMFDPLGMRDTFFQVPQAALPRMTTNYFIAGPGPIPLDPGPTTVFADKPAFPFGGAGLVSSAHDYDRFLAMLMGEGTLDGVTIMSREAARLGMSNLLPDGVIFEGEPGKPAGFGAGGRVATSDTPGGAGAGAFGWGGAAGTIAFADRKRGVRGSGYVQFMPYGAYPFADEAGKAIYADIA